MKYPKVGEKFYWKTKEGEIIESTCFKIEKEDNGYGKIGDDEWIALKFAKKL